MNLYDLNKLCEKFEIDPNTVTFCAGYREVYALLDQQDFEKIFPPVPESEDYATEEAYFLALEQWQELEENNPYCRGEADYSIWV